MGEMLRWFIVDYAASGKSRCRLEECFKIIDQDSLRFGEYEQSNYGDFRVVRWFHQDCFINKEWQSIDIQPKSTGDFDNYDNIRWEDQQKTREIIEMINRDCNENWRKISLPDDEIEDLEPPRKKMKAEFEDPVEIAMRKQNEMFFNVQYELKDLSRDTLRLLLWHNKQHIPRGNTLLNSVTDAMLFGALEPCEKCSGKFTYVSGLGYKCTGDSTTFTKCEEVTQDPTRIKFVVPIYLQDKSWILQFYPLVVWRRIVRVTLPSTSNSCIYSKSNSNIQFPIPMVIDIEKSGVQKLQVMSSGVVDPESGFDRIAHVHQNDRDIYSVTLARACSQQNKNSYYKLQILKYNEKELYVLFRIWGRIGTTIGEKKPEFLDLQACIEKFEQLYFEKTGNKWSDRGNFVKKANKMYPIDTDHGEDEIRKAEVKSQLEPAVQELMKHIFDTKEMKRVIKEYNLNLGKMPLGNLSKDQLLKAYKVLTAVANEMLTELDSLKLTDASHKFYTIVPHSFGLQNIPIFKSQEDIKLQCDKLSSLLYIETAYNLLSLDINAEEPKNILDINYEKLKTEIVVLDKTSEIYKVIQIYVQSSKHKDYDLEIDEVFVVKREGEEERYEPFKNLPNRKLLWHGSHMTNFAGILSQGLRITPPEATHTGHMFGKGIYFADTVVKSANYCKANGDNPTGLLLLCEVALGNMHECTQEQYIRELPTGKNSTIGHGKTRPDPTIFYETKNGVEVPYGPGIRTHIHTPLKLSYNEYIVYNVDQVKVQYLVKVKFLFHNLME